MPEVVGKLINGQTAYLEFNNYVKVITERGLFSKTREDYVSIYLPEISLIEMERGYKPYEKSYRLKIKYQENELLFFTSNEKILEVKDEITEAYNNYLEKIEEEKRNFYKIRKNHLAQISLNLELCDKLFKILLKLNGPVNWSGIEEDFKQFVMIYHDIEFIKEPQVHNITIKNMGQYIEFRHIEELFNEIFGLLDTIYRGNLQTSLNKVKYFNERYHKIFFSIIFMVWDHNLSKLTGLKPIDKSNIERELISLSDRIGLELKEVRRPSRFEYIDIINYLNYNIQCLEKVEFEFSSISSDYLK
jgi:hypothetical protein